MGITGKDPDEGSGTEANMRGDRDHSSELHFSFTTTTAVNEERLHNRYTNAL